MNNITYGDEDESNGGIKMSNFTFLNKKWTTLAKLGTQAENYLYTDSNASMLKMRMFGEQIIDYILAAMKAEVDRFTTQDEKIKLLSKNWNDIAKIKAVK